MSKGSLPFSISHLLLLSSTPLRANNHLQARRGGERIPRFFILPYIFLFFHSKTKTVLYREKGLFGIWGEAYPVLLKLP